MAKIVYNACYGGFSLSDRAIKRYAELKGITLYPEGERHSITYFIVPPKQRKGRWDSTEVLSSTDIARDDDALAQVVEELGEAASGMCSKLRIEEVPDGTGYRIEEHDGNERVETSNDWLMAGASRLKPRSV